MRAQKFKTYRVDADTCRQLSSMAKDLGDVSENHLVEQCLREMIELINAPREEPPALPKIVAMVHAARSHTKSPRRFQA